jgi:putative ABC transport system substrate-binding protein
MNKVGSKHPQPRGASERSSMADPKLIGIMHSGTDGRHKDHIDAFKAGLKWAGFDETEPNPKVKIKVRYADDKHNDLDTIARDFVDPTKENVDLLVAAGGTASAEAAKKATNTKPIVFTSISTSVRPAPNMTGICARTTELDPTRLILLSKILPNEKEFGVLINKTRLDYATQKADLLTQAGRLKLSGLAFGDIDPDKATSVKKQIEDTFTYWKSLSPPYKGALIAADPLFNNHRKDIIDAAKNKKIAAVYQWREFVEEEGLISSGPNILVAYTLAGVYAGYLIDTSVTTNPIDLDVLRLEPELVINLKTAAGLKLKIPPEVLAQADRIIV